MKQHYFYSDTIVIHYSITVVIILTTVSFFWLGPEGHVYPGLIISKSERCRTALGIPLFWGLVYSVGYGISSRVNTLFYQKNLMVCQKVLFLTPPSQFQKNKYL